MVFISGSTLAALGCGGEGCGNTTLAALTSGGEGCGITTLAALGLALDNTQSVLNLYFF